MERMWRAECICPCTPEEVWSVLTDLEAYPRWNPFTREVRTTFALGSPVRMRVDMGRLGVLSQTETMAAFEPGRRLAWALSRPPRWLLWARRDQTLEPLPDGTTRYVTEDRIGGLLLMIVAFRYGGALTEGFEALTRALAEECAQRYS